MLRRSCCHCVRIPCSETTQALNRNLRLRQFRHCLRQSRRGVAAGSYSAASGDAGLEVNGATDGTVTVELATGVFYAGGTYRSRKGSNSFSSVEFNPGQLDRSRGFELKRTGERHPFGTTKLKTWSPSVQVRRILRFRLVVGFLHSIPKETLENLGRCNCRMFGSRRFRGGCG